MPPFIITLPNEKEKLYTRLAGFIYILNVFLIAYSLVSSSLSNMQQSLAITSLLLAIITAVISLLKPVHGRREFFLLLSFFTFVIYWAYLGLWWIGLILIALVMLYYIAKRRLLVFISQEEIVYPSWPERKINWAELNNVILKDGLFTIDFKNNKLIQQMIDGSKTSINEKEFNEFCQGMLRPRP